MKLTIRNDGWVSCKSSFYRVSDILNPNDVFEFHSGINRLYGEIDSGIFAISYLISMYDKIPKNEKKLLFSPHVATLDGKEISLSALTKLACYLDSSYPLFSSKKSARKLIEKGLKKSKLSYTVNDVFDFFKVQDFHRDIAISSSGTERMKIMAAVGFAYGKEIFCFPWFSKMRSQAFGKHPEYAMYTLEALNKIVIVPESNNQSDVK